MKINRLFAAVAAALISLASVFGQPRPGSATSRPAPTTTQPAAANVVVPDSKVALVFSQDFQDQKTGIVKFTALMNQLTREFEPREKELQLLQQKINDLQAEIQKLQQQGGNPQVIQQKMDQLEQMKKDYQRKGEDGQAAFNKRRDELLGPLQADIGNALEAYAKAHNINVLIDGSAVPVIYFDQAIDVTRAFIAEFNSKNPATASVTTPR